MWIAVVVVVISVLAVAVVAWRQKSADSGIDARRRATAERLGLSTADRGWDGEIDGSRTWIYPTRSDAFAGLDDVYARSPATNHFTRQLTVGVEVATAPSSLAFGPVQPALRRRAPTGDAEFDQRFAVREADPSTLNWLNERRRQLLLGGPPLVWMVESILLVHVGRLDEADPESTVRRVVDMAHELR